MRQVQYKDKDGRYWLVKLPDGVPDSDASLGVPIGPPPLEGLGLPKEVEVSLHNQLFSRKIFTSRDIRVRRADVVGALQSAFKMDSERIFAHYLQWENGNSAK